jgi:TfuA protein
MCDTFVFLGPSMSRSQASSLLDAEFLPPICRGDLAKLPASAKFVGIIDGEFCQSLAVSSKELVVLLECGVKIFGGASMGALRAAETHSLGTIGVGSIFEMFRTGVLDADDEVALVYEPESYRALSEPLVNIRQALDLALSANVIGAPERDRLVREMKACYFPERSYRALEQRCPPLGPFFADAVLPDLKRSDASLLLGVMKEFKIRWKAELHTVERSSPWIGPVSE